MSARRGSRRQLRNQLQRRQLRPSEAHGHAPGHPGHLPTPRPMCRSYPQTYVQHFVCVLLRASDVKAVWTWAGGVGGGREQGGVRGAGPDLCGARRRVPGRRRLRRRHEVSSLARTHTYTASI
eukprot:3376641-Rhodomonas_salina.1